MMISAMSAAAISRIGIAPTTSLKGRFVVCWHFPPLLDLLLHFLGQRFDHSDKAPAFWSLCQSDEVSLQLQLGHDCVEVHHHLVTALDVLHPELVEHLDASHEG